MTNEDDENTIPENQNEKTTVNTIQLRNKI